MSAATGLDVIEAAHRDRLAHASDRTVTDQEMRDLPAAAVAWTFPRLSPDEREDLASEVRMYLARRHGWNPPLSALSRPLLARRAATLYRDNRQRWADVKDASAATDADETASDPASRTDAFSSWAGAALPAADAEWREVAAGLGIDPDSGAGDVIYAALSGYGSSGAVAVVRGISEGSARVRLTRGRKQLRDRFRSPDALADALADADMADRPAASAPVLADSRQRLAVTVRRECRVAAGPCNAARRLARVADQPTAALRVLAWIDAAPTVANALLDGTVTAATYSATVAVPGSHPMASLQPTNPAMVASERVRLDSERKLLRRVLDRISPVATVPHVAKRECEPRLDAPRRVIGPAAVPVAAITYSAPDAYRPMGRPAADSVARRERVAATVTDADADATWVRVTRSR